MVGVGTVFGAIGQGSGGDAQVRVGARSVAGAGSASSAVRVDAGAVDAVEAVGAALEFVIVGDRDVAFAELVGRGPGAGVRVAAFAATGMVPHHVVTRRCLRARTHRDRQGDFRNLDLPKQRLV